MECTQERHQVSTSGIHTTLAHTQPCVSTHIHEHEESPPPNSAWCRGTTPEVSPGSQMYPHLCVHPMIMYTFTPQNKHPFLLDHSSYSNTQQATLSLWAIDCEPWSDITAPNIQPSIFLHTLLWAVFPPTPTFTASRLSIGPSSGVPCSTSNFLREAS